MYAAYLALLCLQVMGVDLSPTQPLTVEILVLSQMANALSPVQPTPL